MQMEGFAQCCWTAQGCYLEENSVCIKQAAKDHWCVGNCQERSSIQKRIINTEYRVYLAKKEPQTPH